MEVMLSLGRRWPRLSSSVKSCPHQSAPLKNVLTAGLTGGMISLEGLALACETRRQPRLTQKVSPSSFTGDACARNVATCYLCGHGQEVILRCAFIFN